MPRTHTADAPSANPIPNLDPTPAPGPDLFTAVHRGLRVALFEVGIALGRAGADAARTAEVRALLVRVLHFVRHHGDNEDVILGPILEAYAPHLAALLHTAHGPVEAALVHLENLAAAEAPLEVLYHATQRFTALYLSHMDEEEAWLDPLIRAHVPVEVLAGFGPASVARTAPEDKVMMLGWLFHALNPTQAEAYAARLPAPLADQLRPLARAENVRRPPAP